MLRSYSKHYIKLLIDGAYRIERNETRRLRSLPRFEPTATSFLGHRLKLVDAPTFLEGVDEIFGKRIYDFVASTSQPVIIDCGANIGLSTIYFKQRYPESEITAFEPDPQIFDALTENIQEFGLSKVALVQKAIFDAETTTKFQKEGGYSGRLALAGDDENLIDVKTARLRDYLLRKVDFLKVDIEGAECRVLKDCAGVLSNVENLFVEYHSHVGGAQELHELLEVIHDAGFRYHVKEAYAAQLPFLERPLMLGMDLQLNIFGFRA